jgi:DNA polymerase III subunit beta
MKFLVSSNALLKQLNAVSGVITSSPVVPILENFLFEINDGVLTITASDLQTSMITEMPVESKDKGKIAVPARILIDTLRNLPEQPVNFSVDEDTYTIEISSDNGRYKLAGENATDFPKVPTASSNFSIEMPAAILEKAISNTIIAASNDELRPSMMGVFVDLSETSTTFVATDGHRLIRYRRVDLASDANTSIIIPKKSLNLLKSSIPTDQTMARLEFNGSNAFISFANIQMICRLIDERFPDYQNAIPVNNPNQLFIDRAELLNSLKRISIYANKTTHQVRLKIAGSELQISAEDLDFSNEANERLACEYEGQDMEIGFNAKFLVEMLSNLEAKRVCMHLSAPNRAGLITPAEQANNEDILMLVMPVMLTNYA